MAGDARAARLADASEVPQPAHGRQPIEDGDYLLLNDKIGVVIEGAGKSDGYGRFGGEILSVDRVGPDGQLLGQSKYIETLMGMGLMMPKVAEDGGVTVIQDGSDGGEAVVRALGKLAIIPFLDGPFANLFESDFDLTVAYDYVLAPGAEKLTVRVHVLNPSPELVDFGVNKSAKDEIYGFFHASQNALVTAETGFDEALLSLEFAGFAGNQQAFAWRAVDGPLAFGLEQSGFTLMHGTGFEAAGCSVTVQDRVEIIVGGPYYDGLREAIRRVDNEQPWRSIQGKVIDDSGSGVAGAWVHLSDEDDLYLSRTKSGADGSYTIHAPPGAVTNLRATHPGYQHDGQSLAANDSGADLKFKPHATLEIATKDQAARELPVRIQVIPAAGLDSIPASFGVEQQVNGRLHQHFAMDGKATLVVPPGEHRVLVSRGYEYELYDTTVTATAGQATVVDAVLERSVDSSGIMCADFHIHSHMSADSSDPIDFKVKGAIADGLDIPVSSEHEWVVDFGPIVKQLGMESWAFGMASSELTTFTYGHFGVIPILATPGAYNNGAVDWLGRSPAETFAAVDELGTKPALIVNHPRGGIGGYFSSVLLAKDGTSPAKDLYSPNFDAIEVFNDATFDGSTDVIEDWFALLKSGKRVSAVGSSDSHKLRTSPVGYPRTCFPFGHDDPSKLTPETIRDGILQGSATISGGLLMLVQGPNDSGPGAELPAGEHSFNIEVRSPSWIAAKELEVYVDGERVETLALTNEGTATGRVYKATFKQSFASGSFVVFHARGDGDLAPLHPGRAPFAASNPVFFK